MRRTSSALRWLDRYLGIPAVALFALAPRRPMPPRADVHRIGLLKTAALGDTLLLSGTLASLRAEYPDAHITLITGAANAAAAALLAPWHDAHVEVCVRSPVSAVRTLRALHLDVLLDAGPWPRFDALVTALSGARHRVGFSVAGQVRHHAFDTIIAHDSTQHQARNFHRLAEVMGAQEYRPPALMVSGGGPSGAPLPPDRLPASPFVIVHPWSGGYMGHVKEWRDDRWAALAAALTQQLGLRVLVSGSAAELPQSEALAALMRARGAHAECIAGRYSFTELAQLCLAAHAVVSVNTGVMHLAALVGARTVSLEGPTPLHRWGPIGPHVASIVSDSPGAGYLDLGFEYEGRPLDVMDGVRVDDVLAAVIRLAGNAPSDASSA